MNFDQRMQQTALALINKRGKTVIYTSIVPGVYNPATLKTAAATSAAHPIKAVVGNVGGSDLIDGTLVPRSDKSLLIAALSLPVVPVVNDAVTLDGERFLVHASNPEYAGELPVTYKLKMRRA